MTRRGLIGLFLGGASALLLSGCDLFLPRRAFRMRMTVEVATPLGVKTGSSVIEMVAETRVPLGTNSMSRYSGGLSRGEAAVVELSGGPLFVLLKDGNGSNNYSGQLWHALNGGADLDNDDVMAFVGKMGGGDYKAELPRAEWPMMVRFRDLNDPKSVERVDPAAVGVRRILLETTEDDVTVGIEKRFPTWFGRLIDNRAQLSGKSSSIISTNELADNLGPGSFGTEIGK